MADLRPLHNWTGPPAVLTLWAPSASSLEHARSATVSPVPPSYEQAQHLRSYLACEQRHEEMSRLLIFVWEETGQCEPEVMSRVLTAHVRRHDTYHNRFEIQDDQIQRWTIAEPTHLTLQATTIGQVSSEDWQRHIANTPSPLNWDCFRFGILQRSTGFTFFACIDHLHADSSTITVLVTEIHAQYRALTRGENPPQLLPPYKYLDYCIRQSQRTSEMKLSSPEVSEWVHFLHRNQGGMPSFALPLGISEDRCPVEYTHLEVLDDASMNAFEAKCQSYGVRPIGGLLAAAAVAERELTASKRYRVVTPTSTRQSPQEFLMSGWCMGLVPIDFAVDDLSIKDLAVSAQQCFDNRRHLADVPIERVLELAAELPTIRPAASGGVMLSYMDMRRLRLKSSFASDWHEISGRVFINRGMAEQVSLWLFRTRLGLSLTLAYPANQTARDSIKRYFEAFSSVCQQKFGSS